MVALYHAPIISKTSQFYWNGFLFQNDMEYADFEDVDEERKTFDVALMSGSAICDSATRSLASRKLGEVFKALIEEEEWHGLRAELLFSFILRSKPPGWLDAAQKLVIDVDRRNFYLREFLGAARHQFRKEVNSARERSGLKRLIATVMAKRDMKKNNPGEHAISRSLKRMEDSKFFLQEDENARSDEKK